MLIPADNDFASAGESASEELVVIGVFANEFFESGGLVYFGVFNDKVENRVQANLGMFLCQNFSHLPILVQNVLRNHQFEIPCLPALQGFDKEVR